MTANLTKYANLAITLCYNLFTSSSHHSSFPGLHRIPNHLSLPNFSLKPLCFINLLSPRTTFPSHHLPHITLTCPSTLLNPLTSLSPKLSFPRGSYRIPPTSLSFQHNALPLPNLQHSFTSQLNFPSLFTIL